MIRYTTVNTPSDSPVAYSVDMSKAFSRKKVRRDLVTAYREIKKLKMKLQKKEKDRKYKVEVFCCWCYLISKNETPPPATSKDTLREMQEFRQYRQLFNFSEKGMISAVHLLGSRKITLL